jgi:phage-related protein
MSGQATMEVTDPAQILTVVTGPAVAYMPSHADPPTPEHVARVKGAARTPTRRWRDYRTAAGGRPVKKTIDALTSRERAAIVAGMKDVVERGLVAAKHLRGDVYEVRADAPTRSFRLLFAAEGRQANVLLSLSAFEKRTQKTPPREIEIAERRLRDWRDRGARGRGAAGSQRG